MCDHGQSNLYKRECRLLLNMMSRITETNGLDSISGSHQNLNMKPTPNSGKPPCFGREIYHENHRLIRPNEDRKTGDGKCGVCHQSVGFHRNESGEWVPRFHCYK